MTDEPTLGEIKRTMEAGFATVNSNLHKKVDQGVYEADQRRIDDDITDLKVALAKEEGARERGDDKQQTLLDKMSTNLKWLVAVVLLPTAFFAVNIYLSLRKSP